MLTKVKAARSTKAKVQTAAQRVASGLAQQASVQNDFGYVQAKNNAALTEQDYAAETARQVEQAKVAQTGANLQQDMATNTARHASAEDYAARGILRSGLQVSAQNGITAQDITARNAAAQQEAGVEGNRQAGQLSLQTANRDATAKALNTATQNYYNTLKKAK